MSWNWRDACGTSRNVLALIAPLGARLSRPSETVLEILPQAASRA